MNEEIMKEILAELKLQTKLLAKLTRDTHLTREATASTEFYGSAELDIEPTLGWKKHIHYVAEMLEELDVPDEEEKKYW